MKILVKKINIEKAFLFIVSFCLAVYFANSIYVQQDSDLANITLTVLFSGLSFVTMLGYSYYRWDRKHVRSPYMKWLVMLTLIMGVVNLLSSNEGANLNGLAYNLITSFLPLFSFIFAYLTLKRLDYDLKSFWGYLFFLASIVISYFYFKEFTISNMFGDEYASIGAAYYPMFLLPMVLWARNKWVNMLSIAIVFIVILSSMKRGGTIALIGSLVVFVFVHQFFVKTGKYALLKAFGVFLLIIALLLGAFIYVDNMYGNWLSERLMALRYDGGSGRVDVWAETCRMILTNTLPEWFLGNGTNAVLRDSTQDLSAHNDFLEITYNYGVVVFFAYVMLHVVCVKQALRLMAKKSQLAPYAAMSYTQFLLLSMISHITVYPWFPVFTLFWGALTALEHKEKELERLSNEF